MVAIVHRRTETTMKARHVLEPSAITVNEFCYKHRICRATFYNLRRTGRGPAVIKIGARTLVSMEAAAAWRRDLEQRNQP
jgi:hypothetical protein